MCVNIWSCLILHVLYLHCFVITYSHRLHRYRMFAINALYDIDPHYPAEECARFVTDHMTPSDTEESLFLNIRLRNPEIRQMILNAVGQNNKTHTKKVVTFDLPERNEVFEVVNEVVKELVAFIIEEM